MLLFGQEAYYVLGLVRTQTFQSMHVEKKQIVYINLVSLPSSTSSEPIVSYAKPSLAA